ncbi:MAG: hypothetical protein M0C28_20295 [Candidatus Moduliflexus flocculans]|nr:hypothetical protein [Candidatus Moduliflexus flocculans]
MASGRAERTEKNVRDGEIGGRGSDLSVRGDGEKQTRRGRPERTSERRLASWHRLQV